MADGCFVAKDKALNANCFLLTLCYLDHIVVAKATKTKIALIMCIGSFIVCTCYYFLSIISITISLMHNMNYCRCVHYKRRCKIRAPCCNQIFYCRHCHNEAMVLLFSNYIFISLLQSDYISRKHRWSDLFLFFISRKL